MAKKVENTNRSIKIRIDFEKPPQEKIPLIGFLFNCKGILIQWQNVKGNILEFNLGKTGRKEMQMKIDPEQFRLFIAPATDSNITRISTPEELLSYKAYEPIISLDANRDYSILPIPESLSVFWWFCKCRVTGKVSKWFNVGSSWEDRPVCKARVHICEIDPIGYWIYKIPDHIIAKIPDAILNPVFELPIPIPDSEPFQKIARFKNIEELQENIFKTRSLADMQREVEAKLPELGSEMKQKLTSGNLQIIRETLAENYKLLHPWFCFWPWWWPYFYRCKELAVVETNANGRFEKDIYYHCFGDKPDIYIWVEYRINGEWTTVYKPSKPCHTYWNYACGTDINIHLTHSMVVGDCCCNCHLPGQNVWLRSVGHTSVSHIEQTHQLLPPPGQTVAYDRIGLTDAGAYGDWFLSSMVDDYKRPFGGNPILRMGFGSDLPNTNMYYYRWSYKKMANADLTPVGDSYHPLQPIGGEVRKGYDYIYLDSNGDEQWSSDSVKLGPFTKGSNDDLYIIPPELPEMAPFNVPATSNPHWHQQTYNMDTIHFDSTKLPGDGLYILKLELFDKNGNLLQNLAKSTFKTPKHNHASQSENAPDILLENPTATQADAFNFIMRIDNGACDGDIYTVNVNGMPASTNCCGFVKYKPHNVEADLELTFRAVHPTDFAVFRFGVVKGSCGGVPIANAKGMVLDSASGYALNTITGIYSKTFTPSELLGECYDTGTGKAAFAETLHILSMATDGIRRVAKDYGKTVAFALEP